MYQRHFTSLTMPTTKLINLSAVIIKQGFRSKISFVQVQYSTHFALAQSVGAANAPKYSVEFIHHGCAIRIVHRSIVMKQNSLSVNFP